MTGEVVLHQRPGLTTGIVAGGGIMGGIALIGTREGAGDSPAMNHPGTEVRSLLRQFVRFGL